MSTSVISERGPAARVAAVLAGIWTGGLLTIGVIAAPSAFANAARDVAGRIAGQMLSIEARIGLLIAVALILLLRRHQRRQPAQSSSPLFGVDLMLVFGAVFSTVAGHFAMQPLFDAARAGEGALSFAALHAFSVAFFGLKTLLVASLAWRLAALR